jgi:recombination protein RecA
VSLGEDKANMLSAFTLRSQIENALAHRIPSALTPAPKIIRSVMPSGINSIDNLLDGGLPLGAITEIVGSESSGRTSCALSFLAQVTQDAKVCAWVDVSDTLHPESAAAVGVELKRLLWVRCGVSSVSELQCPQSGFKLPEKYLIPKPIKKNLHGGGFGPHPCSEVKGLSDAVKGFLHFEAIAPRCAEPQRRIKIEREPFEPNLSMLIKSNYRLATSGKPWSRIEQALRVTDLLLQAGGFSAIVLDMGSIAPEFALRIPMATWFRYRAAAEKTQACILLLTQHTCARSSAGLVLRLQSSNALQQETTVFAGIEYQAEISRQRFVQNPSNVIPLRKPPQSVNIADWQTRTTWAGCR